MINVLVIADDFTGAAEIAGIGHRFGLEARVFREPPPRLEAGLTVIDTDSRSLVADEAARTVTRIALKVEAGDYNLIYKKTDSVLRGPIAAELNALLTAFARRDALLVPQNPSRGRVIVNGEYRIGDAPLHETPFANDPTHPIRSSRVAELVPAVLIADGASHPDLLALAARLDRSTLPAGGADFFTAILERAGLSPARGPLDRLPTGPTLYVSGSTSDASRVDGVPQCVLSESAAKSCDDVCCVLSHRSRAMLTIGRALEEGTKATACVVRRGGVASLLVTGGATASAVCRELDWIRFDVGGEFAVGVVQLRPCAAGAPSLIVKPGSYSWPPAVLT